MKKIITSTTETNLKQNRLENIKLTLKKEFVGIDNIIDSVISCISSWYTFPHVYQRPLVINLWGLTGIGKTSLIKRIVELLDFEKRYLRFNLSEREDDFYKIKYSLSNLTKGVHKKPLIIALDEFQNFRTLDEARRDNNANKNQVIWDLIDSGKIQYSEFSHMIFTFRELLVKLKYCVANGVIVSKGRVIKNASFYIKLMEQTQNNRKRSFNVIDGEEKPWFIPTSLDVDICDERMDLFNEPLLVRDHLKTMNAEESIVFIENLIEDILKPKMIDCSNSLVFILGNLDEAYTMSDNFNPDMNADEFYEESLKISITQIKNALKYRFRNEQIARLGNNHLIYPSLSSEHYRAFIKLELDKLAERIRLLSDIDVKFSASVHDLIYSEGVFPTQGCRPVLSTIYQLLHSKIGLIHYNAQLNREKSTELFINYETGELLFKFSSKGNSPAHCVREYIHLNMAELRKEPRDEQQAITAVHEAGHAVISIALLDTIPEYIYSVTADADSGGFTLSKPNLKYRSKNQLLPKLAMLFAGLMAEKMIFGTENITAGSETDIQRATNMASQSIKSLGFGDEIGHYQVKNINANFDLFDEGDGIQTAIKKLLLEAQNLAEVTLKENKALLLAIADVLKDNSLIKKVELKQLTERYAPALLLKFEESKKFYFRNTLVNQISEMSQKSNHRNITSDFSISLNIDKTKN